MTKSIRKNAVRVQVGRIDTQTREDWVSSGLVSSVIAWPWGASSGRRWGRRSLGLGVDAVAAALWALVRHPRSRFLAANPWIGVALRMCRRDVMVTGLYATPGTRSWQMLRRMLGSAPVVTLSEVEADNWRDAGGRARAVRYGATLGYPMRSVPLDPDRVRVFVGGASDRDLVLLNDVIRDAEQQQTQLDFVLCIGDVELPGALADLERVEQHGAVSQAEFGRLLSTCDVAFLPLADTHRAAGHMVAVGALESGIPVVASPTAGMHDYFELHGVYEALPHGVINQLISTGLGGREMAKSLRQEWSTQVSRRAYAHRVAQAIRSLDCQ